MPELGETQSHIDQSTPAYEAYVKLIERAIEALGSEDAANHWINTPQPRFGGQIPMNMAISAGFSMEPFEEYFSRIEHGIYG